VNSPFWPLNSPSEPKIVLGGTRLKMRLRLNLNNLVYGCLENGEFREFVGSSFSELPISKSLLSKDLAI